MDLMTRSTAKPLTKITTGSGPPPPSPVIFCCAVCAGHLTAHVGTAECHCTDNWEYSTQDGPGHFSLRFIQHLLSYDGVWRVHRQH